MLYYFLFSFIVLIASIIGAIAGIGGGVIIRPVLDAFGYFDEAIITNVISGFCVLVGSITSVTKNIVAKNKIEGWKHTIFLGTGAAIGGIIGQIVFSLIKEASNKNIIVIAQSSVLIILLLFVAIYMQFFKDKGYQLKINNYILDSLIGLLLGIFSSFLGIGGGPINVAILVLFFSMSMKQAAINSLIIIIFSQTFKFGYMLINGDLISLFTNPNLSNNDSNWWIFLIIFIIVSVGGSLFGSYLNKKFSDKLIQYVYVGTLFVIIAINIYLITTNAIALI